MPYNRSLDLMAVSLAATAAGLPVKAAKYMHAAAKDTVAAKIAIDVIGAVNVRETAAKKKKKKEKSEFKSIFAGVEDDEMPEDETAADEGDEDEKDDAEVMKVESSSLASRLRIALAGAEELDDEDEAEAEKDSEEKDEDASVTAARKLVAKADAAKAAKKVKARKVRAMPELEGDISELEPNEVGQECKEEVPDHKEAARFARTLRNLAARQAAK